MRFSFGANWSAYSKRLTARHVEEAAASIRGLLQVDDLRGRRVVDVGAGSGVFTAAALRLGAREVVALDRDPQCVDVIRANTERLLTPAERARLHVVHGDILAPDTLPRPGFDVVYAWGSLHHTGRMWEAVANAASLCGPAGTFVVALYNRTPFYGVWRRVKRLYNQSPQLIRTTMVLSLAGPRAIVRAVTGRSPFDAERAMSVWYDAIDWLGGLPYEAATPEEVVQQVSAHGYTLSHARLTRRHGCNEFVFVRWARERAPCA